ncbi:hypothetical protein BFP97_07520 [Roseivirga sp. 4D4]|uniref:hypothetical protein n=1 Tax=Roseivirga sp. 4D4 TaxID=1889784 RepID=UPI0008533F15|nr:hypothetical protein [Roseivirga sp. 4D4]OEK01374.1 hypothetical protein BFP97_07520 [Roseivirga sp. 4D4]
MSKSEKLTQFLVMIVAVCAVVVSVWQVRISQQHNKLSVMPYLDFFSGWASDSTWRLTLMNEGIGPAIIKSTELTYDEKVYTHWDAVLDAANIRDRRVNSTNVGNDSPFKIDKEIVFLEIKNDPLNPVTFGIDVLIRYTSIYGGEIQELTIGF